MRRRSFLKRAGALTILVAGGQVWRAFGDDLPEIGEGAAFEPWRTWRQDANEGPLALVRAAILSSNAYNSQPWIFKVSAAKIELHADTRRNLGAFDPYLREMHLSLGCAIENLMLTAAARGYSATLTLSPGKLGPAPSEGVPEEVARIDLTPGSRRTGEIYEAIPHRHTNRDLFDVQRPIPGEFLQDLSRLEEMEVKTFLFTGEKERAAIVELIADASTTFLSDADVRRGTEGWFRTTPDQVQRLRDGVDLTGAAAGRPAAAPQSYVSLMSSGRLFGLIAVRDRYDRAQTLRAGRLWQRAHLLATARGLAARPANGAVELIDHGRRLNREFPAIARLAGIVGDATWQPTFMFYTGYATVAARASARRAVGEVVV